MVLKLRIALVLLLTAASCIGDRVWLHTTTASLPRPITKECASVSLARLPSVDSVRAGPRVPTAYDSSASVVEYLLMSKSEYSGWVTAHTRNDSSAVLTTSWMVAGGKPPRESIEYHRRVQATVLTALAHDCARAEPQLVVSERNRP